MTETHNEDVWITVQDQTPAPPLEHPYAAASGDRHRLIGLASRELVEDLGRPTFSHLLEGRASFHRGPDGPTLTALVATPDGARLTPTRVYLTLLDEPNVLELPQPVLDALRGYAMDWPNSAHRIHWHERVGVPVIARIRHVACLFGQYHDEWDRYPDERGEDDWTAPAMASVGLVEPDPDPAVVAARVAAKWPGLWGKYGQVVSP